MSEPVTEIQIFFTTIELENILAYAFRYKLICFLGENVIDLLNEQIMMTAQLRYRNKQSSSRSLESRRCYVCVLQFQS